MTSQLPRITVAHNQSRQIDQSRKKISPRWSSLVARFQESIMSLKERSPHAGIRTRNCESQSKIIYFRNLSLDTSLEEDEGFRHPKSDSFADCDGSPSREMGGQSPPSKRAEIKDPAEKLTDSSKSEGETATSSSKSSSESKSKTHSRMESKKSTKSKKSKPKSRPKGVLKSKAQSRRKAKSKRPFSRPDSKSHRLKGSATHSTMKDMPQRRDHLRTRKGKPDVKNQPEEDNAIDNGGLTDYGFGLDEVGQKIREAELKVKAEILNQREALLERHVKYMAMQLQEFLKEKKRCQGFLFQYCKQLTKTRQQDDEPPTLCMVPGNPVVSAPTSQPFVFPFKPHDWSGLSAGAQPCCFRSTKWQALGDDITNTNCQTSASQLEAVPQAADSMHDCQEEQKSPKQLVVERSQSCEKQVQDEELVEAPIQFQQASAHQGWDESSRTGESESPGQQNKTCSFLSRLLKINNALCEREYCPRTSSCPPRGDQIFLFPSEIQGDVASSPNHNTLPATSPQYFGDFMSPMANETSSAPTANINVQSGEDGKSYAGSNQAPLIQYLLRNAFIRTHNQNCKWMQGESLSEEKNTNAPMQFPAPRHSYLVAPKRESTQSKGEL